MQARDVMTKDVVAIEPDTPIAEIARLLVERRISGAPVIDAEGRLLGIVSEGDLIRRIEDDDEKESGTGGRRSWWLDLIASPERRAERYIRAHGNKARDVMTSRPLTVGLDTPVVAIARLLEEHHVKRAPVVSDGKVVGIVSRADLLRALATAPAQAPLPDDRALRERLMGELSAAGLDYHPYVNIVVADGVVHLWGFVASRAEADALRLAAEHAAAGATVESHLTVHTLSSSV
jgi:CBS domain-containing protein